MSDARLKKMAQVLVNYSLNVKAGDQILMNGELPGLPLFEALYEELIKVGAYVKINLTPTIWDELFFKYASDDQLKRTCPFGLYEVAHCDKRIRIIAPGNTRKLSQVPSYKQTLASKAQEPILSKLFERSGKNEMDWVVTLYPTAAGAQEANMGLLEYEDFVFDAASLDDENPISFWKSLELEHERMIDLLKQKKKLRFQNNEGTDLTINIDGMKWRNSCGKRNFPDGEVFTGPNLNAADGGANGTVCFTYPAIWQNTVVENVKLVFKNGRVVEAHATKNEEFLREIIKQDEGASKIGEIAIGTNYKIQKFTNNILFDEKIGGTFHLALGMGYPETGNTNKSALHWDMICDLRQSGKITADDEVISENGVYVRPDWPRRQI